MTLSTISREVARPPSPPRRRWAMVAAAVGLVAAGAVLYVRGNRASDDPSPSVTVPDSVDTLPSLPTTVPGVVDSAALAETLLLGEDEYGHGVRIVAHSEIAMDAAIAADLPACEPFDNAFVEPSATAWRWFSPTAGALDPEYVMVFDDERTAATTFDALADPNFWRTCASAYVEVEPGVDRWNVPGQRTFPRYLADDVPEEPLALAGDDHAFFLTRDDAGTVMFAVVRVGRTLATVQASEDINGFPRISRTDFAVIVADIVRKAEAAL